MACSPNCSLCDANGCINCSSSFYMNTDKSCTKCSINCSDCTSGTLCFNCDTGYAL